MSTSHEYIESIPLPPSHEVVLPDTPLEVREAYETYWNVTDTPHSERDAAANHRDYVKTLIGDFCDDYINDSVYSAAALGAMVDAYYSDDPAAKQGLRTYLRESSASIEEQDYVLGIASDHAEIDAFWNLTVADMYADQPELYSTLLGDASAPIKADAWQPRAKLVMPERTLELLDSVNIESLLISSVETLAQLDEDEAALDAKTLQNAYRAEAFLGPLCEIIGFDGLSMALQSRVNTLRAMHTGRQAQVAEASRIIGERGGEQQVDQDVQELFGAIFGENIHEQVLRHGAPHGIIIGEGLATSKNLRVVWRLKSIGSLANKLSRTNPEEFTPMDIIGATVITDTEEQVAERLTRIIERSHNDPNVKLVPTVDRTDAVHVKGTPDYIDTVREVLGFTSVDAMKRFVDVKEVTEGAHRVCKVTLVHSREGRPDLRAEIQLTTAKDRVEARIGSAAHLLYKFAGATNETPDPAIFAAIHARKEELTRPNAYLVPASAERARALRRDLALAA